ncbi:hypothetical protein ACS0TY_006782 [Phlomoides rotata]
MVIQIKRSNNVESGRQPRVMLTCERSEEVLGQKNVVANLCLQGNQIGSECQWELKVVCGTHSHPISQFLEGHTYVGRLTPAQDAFVLKLSMINGPPVQILDALKKEWPNTKATLRHIYNVRLNYRVVERKG